MAAELQVSELREASSSKKSRKELGSASLSKTLIPCTRKLPINTGISSSTPLSNHHPATGNPGGFLSRKKQFYRRGKRWEQCPSRCISVGTQGARQHPIVCIMQKSRSVKNRTGSSMQAGSPAKSAFSSNVFMLLRITYHVLQVTEF